MLRIARRYCSMSGSFVPEPFVERVDALLGRERPQDRPPDVSRQHVGDDEHERRQQPQRDQ